ncbi:MAG: hypothetical protein NPINA01_14460 [Nitrospinaceae bacterium]|nr:MAG: hypothetical protein NPINA01_14460 [Nitrospinaceae bacterium]
MNPVKPEFKNENPSHRKKQRFWIAFLIGILALNLTGFAQADDADEKRVLSSWRSDGTVYSMSKNMDFYTGVMKGTFFVKDHTGKTHFTHATRLTCPFSVQINKGGKDELQGMCQLVNQRGDRANARISCTGEKENCNGDWKFTAGSGALKGIKGGGKLKIRVDLIKEDSSDKSNLGFGNEMGASGYLIINDLHDNVDSSQEIPKVQ